MGYTHEQLLEKQAEIEERVLTGGVERYRRNLQVRGVAATEPGRRLQTLLIEPAAKTINDWLVDARRTRRGPRAKHVDVLDGMKGGELAALTSAVVMQSIGEGQKITASAKKVGYLVAEHMNMADAYKTDRGLVVKLQRQLKDTNNVGRRRKVVNHALTSCDLTPEGRWSEQVTISVGRVLIELMVESSNLLELETVYRGNRTDIYLRPTAACLEFLKDGHARAELTAPTYAPMVVPPTPWSNLYDGGYLFRRCRLVKIYDKDQQALTNEADMPEVYDAINAIQDTGYRVNRPILALMQRVWDEGDTVGKIVNRDPLPLPGQPKEWDLMTEEEQSNWKYEAAKVHESNAKAVSKRISTDRKLCIAQEYKDYPAIYFPHNMDWRGRAYPIPTDLQPQGDDIAKGLLQLAEGKMLTDDGVYWLKVHIANLFGVDKVDFDSRVAWVDDNLTAMMESVIDPLDGDRFWTTADKPWQALAALMDLAGYHLDPDHLSHTIIGMDGSCNGLQHLSAMNRDEVGGEAVNLTPSGTPQDIYLQVRDLVQEKLEAESRKDYIELAQEWLTIGELPRSLVKRPVMTKPYGVTNYSITDYILKDMRDDKDTYPFADEDVMDLGRYLTPLVEEAIEEVVVASKVVMNWLQQVAGTLATHAIHLNWITPVGLPVKQLYNSTGRKKVKVYIGGRKVQYWIAVAKGDAKIRAQKASDGASPNFVHSIDAAHLFKTVLLMQAEGLEAFSMVHDSYGCHASDVSTMNRCLREAFVSIYSVDLLADMREQLVLSLGEEIAAELPEVPAMGSLDIAQVLNSPYFFA